MAIEAPTNRADLEEWLARLAGLLQALRLSDQRRNELLSSYRTFKPQITGSRELSKNETYLFIIAAAGIVNLLFYFIFKVMEPGDMVVVAGVTFFVFYKIVQRMWRARGKSTDKEPRFSIGKRVFYIRQLLEALIPTNIIIMIFLLCTYPPIPVLVVTGISIALGIVIGLVSASLAALRLKSFNKKVVETNLRIDEENKQIDIYNGQVEDSAIQEAYRMKEISQEIIDNYRGVFPEKYLDETSVNGFLTLVRNHRASTLTDAINLYQQEQHEQRVEMNQRENLAYQQQIIAGQEETHKRQDRNLVVSTIMQAATISAIRKQRPNITNITNIINRR